MLSKYKGQRFVVHKGTVPGNIGRVPYNYIDTVPGYYERNFQFNIAYDEVMIVLHSTDCLNE